LKDLLNTLDNLEEYIRAARVIDIRDLAIVEDYIIALLRV